ncbi:MAG: molybdopterin synthase catalytic subunit [Halothiobacillaceae bacterium]|nr:MAG: molybdopterin synthase catalytic subunit [Halothiobacillaceae bacterium]
MKVVILGSPFDPWHELTTYEQTFAPGKVGGSVSFVGTMRDYNDGHNVSAMRLDHYPGMTEQHIERVCQEAADQWEIIDALVVHRVGNILPNEAIVLVVVWSAHRANAFDACRYIINYLKERAPFWKQETTATGDNRWVEHNTKDPGVAAR